MPAWLPSVLLFIGSVILGIIAYFLKQTYNELVKRQDRQEEAHTKLRAEFEQFKEQLPYRYVLREDWIRATMNLETKIDKLHDLLRDLLAKSQTGSD